MGVFQPQRRKAETLLLAWLSASLKAFGGAILGSCRLMARLGPTSLPGERPLIGDEADSTPMRRAGNAK